MKKLIGPLIILFGAIIVLWMLLGSAGGCVSVKPAPTTQATLADDVFDATTLYLAARPDRAAKVISVAEQIKTAAQSDVDANTLRTLALKLLLDRAGMSEDQQAASAFLANVIISRVQRRLGYQLDIELAPDGKLDATKATIVEACDAAIAAAEPFKR